MRLIFLALAMWITTGAVAEQFTYKIDHYPPNDIGCPETARATAERFAEAYAVPVDSVYCTAATATGYRFQITYSAAEELPLVSTTRVSGGVFNSLGGYADLESCQANLAAEQAKFSQATGLPYFLSYCYNRGIGRYPYVLRIDGFGDAAAKPRLDGFYIFGAPVELTFEDIATRIFSQLGAVKPGVSYVLADPSIGMTRMTARFYDAGEEPLTYKEYLKLKTEEQCLEQISRGQMVFAQQNTEPLASFCTYIRVTNLFEYNVLFGQLPGVSEFWSLETFAEYDECQANREEIAQLYRDRDGRNVVGSFCGINAGAYGVLMLEGR